MMQPFPFFNFPPFRPPYPPYPYRKSPNFIHNVENTCKPQNAYAPSGSSNKNIHSFSNQVNTQIPSSDCENNEDCFEIFGLKLYFDDLLILALLFFLYQEEVKDTYLYMALILLLLS